jgi:2-polyprenyl-3-methyl-5-hydroxy-6-metoxy-1,4-benzoquinol methylase
MSQGIEYKDYFQLKNPLTKIKSIISHKARKKMYEHFTALVNPTEENKILDVGVTPDTSLVESNFFEKMYPHTYNITMLSVEDASNLEQIFKGAVYVRNEPESDFPFCDKQFDVLFCSAVLEHVGDDDMQRHFIWECMRVAKKVYLTTPNKSFPVEFHTFLPFVHYLPMRIHQKILRALKMDFWAETSNLNLLTMKKLRGMIPHETKEKVKLYYNRLLGIPTNIILFIQD